MKIEIGINASGETKVLDTKDILNISSVGEKMIGDTSNKRHGGWDYTIQFYNNSELEITHYSRKDIEAQRDKLLRHWVKEEIVKI